MIDPRRTMNVQRIAILRLKVRRRRQEGIGCSRSQPAAQGGVSERPIEEVQAAARHKIRRGARTGS